MSAATDLLTALITTLRADATLTAQLASYAGAPAVFTHVPQDIGAYPYVTIYGIESTTDDTHISNRFEGVVSINVWSDSRDWAIVGDIQKTLYNVLHKQDLTVSNFETVEFIQDLETINRDSDAITIVGSQRFNFILQQQ